MSSLLNGLITLNQILAAGISITAFSLLLYALTFNLRDRVARAFAGLLLFVTGVYFGDAVVSTLRSPEQIENFLRLQWIGIAFVPVGYLHFSDALLATTGRPSRGRRRLAIRVLYVTALAFLVAAAFTDVLVHSPVIDPGANTARLSAGPLFPVFSLYMAGCLAWTAWNFVRAYRRCQTATTRRRMLYLMASAAAPTLGTFPFLLLAGQAASLQPLLFWLLALITNAAVTVLLVVMAYTVAYFGVSQPDRVVKARLFQWLLRGPIVASTVLAVYVLIGRYGPAVQGYDARLLPFVVVTVLLLLQFLITLVRVPLERVLFYGADRAELRRLQIVEERLLTTRDLRQFLELVLAALCDALRRPAAFIAAVDEQGRVDEHVSVGADDPLQAGHELPPLSSLRAVPAELSPAGGGLFEWGDFWLMPLRGASSGDLLGLLGFSAEPVGDEPAPSAADDRAVLDLLAERAAAALDDQRLQRDVFQALDRLLPQMEALQRLRASAAIAGASALTAAEPIAGDELPQIVKDALSHYWGGPKLTGSPLMRLRVVERAQHQHDGNAVNALRAVLREAIERLRPEGQRRFTGEWLLYNILELKFMQGARVRDVALRLAVSEADLYRKQRVALEEVASAILEMERDAAARAGAEPAPSANGRSIPG